MNYIMFFLMYNNPRILKTESIKLLLIINAFYVKKFSKHNFRCVTADFLITYLLCYILYYINYESLLIVLASIHYNKLIVFSI